MDYSGNYYREDSMKQLVVAGNETEATVFSFADADRRIGAGKKSKFYFMTPASEEEDNQNIPAARKLTEAEIPEEIEKSVSPSPCQTRRRDENETKTTRKRTVLFSGEQRKKTIYRPSLVDLKIVTWRKQN